ncbi:MAG: hypothetical protein SOX57_04325 [Schaalia hyovaginalis]|nr:hypothetical protein [Schaalia hyovaginalis]MDY3665833.1 hypothetical protein [Schaalia hyovaginalis]MDY4262550.1 hypothetical protein [Schaalia hyovaginalis]MDY5602010.1 hypothetical protein [Schaalia hyovaginalis]
MSRSSAPRPMLLLTFGLASIALTLSACSPAAPKDDAVQSSAQSSADTPQSTIDGVAQSTIDELIELYPEMANIPRDELVKEFIGNAGDSEVSAEERMRAFIEETRENDEAMRRAVEEATDESPVQSR